MEYLQDKTLAELPGIAHGFFTRNGGVSEGIYASLNLGLGSDDSPEAVTRNRHLVADAMRVTPERLLTLYQIHSDKVLIVDGAWNGERPQADGMVTKEKYLALGILTADCAPVLFADPQAGVIGACHAGWKGAIAGVAERTVEAMETLGAQRSRIFTAIGPCIGQASYEVDAAFRARFAEKSRKNALFFANTEKQGHYRFDLPAYIQAGLHECGIASTNILANDTCFHENAFFSYRRKTLRDETDYGRQVSAIVLT